MRYSTLVLFVTLAMLLCPLEYADTLAILFGMGMD